jgi:sugar phosphate isomerase/epimerase
MKPGIFESIFPGETVNDKFAELTSLGFRAVQFDLQSAGLATMPDGLPQHVIDTIRATAEVHDVKIAALAGTYNMIDPDLSVRDANHQRFLRHIESAPKLGSRFVTICTGTRDEQSMWAKHPDNQTDSAWSDLVDALTPALVAAQRHDVVLAVEPEPANVVNNSIRARRLLDDMQSDHLAIIADPANLVAGDPSRSPKDVLTHAFDLLGDRVVLAHAKDLDVDGEFSPAGTGVVPWSHFHDLLQKVNYQGAVILHSLTVSDIPHALQTLRSAGF